MLFKRKTPLHWRHKLRNMIWPKMGWRRVWEYTKHRVIRFDDTTSAIAAGLAIGCAVSWTPVLGLHLFICGFLCWAFRANYMAAFIGSALANPITFPIMMWLAYYAGHIVMVMLNIPHTLSSAVPEGPALEQADDIMIPVMIGGHLLALIAYPVFYYPFYYMITGARLARKMRIEHKAHQVAQEITEHQDTP